ncbi:hypothetical protein NA78x_001905 [Anatilimnocola sp. NA78]|uniref:hypothetical protein n=1 Tax=Anatilimnocola sp. NA78 TaxID=3415683 RepID=UPI003CE50C05
MTRLSFVLIGAALFAFAGCGSSPLNSISGDVTFDGEPVDGGSIVFLPQSEGGSKGSAEIVAGKYAIPVEQGLPPATYRVEIVWHKPTGKQIPSGDPGMLMEERKQVLPAKFNTQSTLTAVVTAEKKPHDFLLTSK